MDDKTFDDRRTALDWIQTVESERSKVRETDIYPILKDWVNQVSPLHVLDIGAGQGVCSDRLDLEGRTYTGVEPSPPLVERAKELYRQKNRHFVLGSVYELPFSDGVFDAAFSVAVWHLLGDLPKAAVQLSHVLKANARFLIITANPGAYPVWTRPYALTHQEGRRFEGWPRDKSEPSDVLYLHTLDEILNSLRSAHLSVTRTETFRAVASSEGLDQFILIQGQK